MSSLPQPSPSRRKPPRSAAEDSNQTYFQYPHSFVSDIPWVAATWCEEYLLHRIMAEVNKRDAWISSHSGDGEYGWTGVLNTAELAKGSRWETRMIQVCIKRLTTSEGPLQVMEVDEAVSAGILGKKEGERSKAKAAYVFRPTYDRWASIAKARRAEDVARRRLAEQDAAEEPQSEDEGESGKRAKRHRVRITAKPVVHRPGEKVERIVLSDEAQNAMALVTSIEPKFKGLHAVAVSFEVNEDRLLYLISEPAVEETKGETTAHYSARIDEGPYGNGRKESEVIAQCSARIHKVTTIVVDQERQIKGETTAHCSARIDATDRGTKGEVIAQPSARIGSENGSAHNGDYPESLAAMRLLFPTTPASFVMKLVLKCKGQFPDLQPKLTDHVIAVAIRESAKSGQRSAGLYLNTVPDWIEANSQESA